MTMSGGLIAATMTALTMLDQCTRYALGFFFFDSSTDLYMCPLQELGVFRREKISNAIFTVAEFVDWFRLWYSLPDSMTYGCCYKLDLAESELKQSLGLNLKNALCEERTSTTSSRDFSPGGPFHSLINSTQIV